MSSPTTNLGPTVSQLSTRPLRRRHRRALRLGLGALAVATIGVDVRIRQRVRRGHRGQLDAGRRVDDRHVADRDLDRVHRGARRGQHGRTRVQHRTRDARPARGRRRRSECHRAGPDRSAEGHVRREMAGERHGGRAERLGQHHLQRLERPCHRRDHHDRRSRRRGGGHHDRRRHDHPGRRIGRHRADRRREPRRRRDRAGSAVAGPADLRARRGDPVRRPDHDRRRLARRRRVPRRRQVHPHHLDRRGDRHGPVRRSGDGSGDRRFARQWVEPDELDGPVRCRRARDRGDRPVDPRARVRGGSRSAPIG